MQSKATESVAGAVRSRILIVDDDDAARASIRRSLEHHGWEVEDVRASAEALASVRSGERPFAVVVMDIVLGGDESGIALAGTLYREDPGLRFLFISGHTDLDVSTASVPTERTAFLGKPLSVTRLVQEVGKLSADGLG